MSDELQAESVGHGSPPITHHSSLITHHSIRLRGAWITSTEGTRVRHSRNFGWPRPLDPGDQLWLVCSHVPETGEVLLNGANLASITAVGPFAVNITESVRPRNTVVFAIEGQLGLGEVTLEVRRPHG